MKTLTLLPVLLAFLFTLGCGEPRIDGSSEEAMKTSIEKISQDLPEEKQKELAGALLYFGMKSGFSNMGATEAEMSETMLKAVDGKTADELIALAKEEVQASQQEEDTLVADGSSDDALIESFGFMGEDMNGQEVERFLGAIAYVERTIRANYTSKAEADAAVLAKFDGKNADEIIAMANEIQQGRAIHWISPVVISCLRPAIVPEL